MKRSIVRLALLALLAVPGLASAQDFQVVVNSANGSSELSKSEVSRLFLKKSTSWPDGAAVYPVDQASGRSVRASFSRAIHGKSVSAVKSYWQKLIFSGRDTPPPELGSDSAVLDYVRDHAGAIGYVSADASLGARVKALRITR